MACCRASRWRLRGLRRPARHSFMKGRRGVCSAPRMILRRDASVIRGGRAPTTGPACPAKRESTRVPRGVNRASPVRLRLLRIQRGASVCVQTARQGFKRRTDPALASQAIRMPRGAHVPSARRGPTRQKRAQARAQRALLTLSRLAAAPTPQGASVTRATQARTARPAAPVAAARSKYQ